jgi:hypothetical protein
MCTGKNLLVAVTLKVYTQGSPNQFYFNLNDLILTLKTLLQSVKKNFSHLAHFHLGTQQCQ